MVLPISGTNKTETVVDISTVSKAKTNTETDVSLDTIASAGEKPEISVIETVKNWIDTIFVAPFRAFFNWMKEKIWGAPKKVDEKPVDSPKTDAVKKSVTWKEDLTERTSHAAKIVVTKATDAKDAVRHSVDAHPRRWVAGTALLITSLALLCNYAKIRSYFQGKKS